MKCLCCGKEMEQGFIKTSGRSMIWTQKPDKITLFTGDDDVDIIYEPDPFCKPTLPAQICKKCKKAVLDY